jgi:hypothetical protein
LVTFALVFGSSAQLVLLGVPVLAGVYGGPAAGFVVALAFPFADGRLGQMNRWLAPSAWFRYAVFRVLVAVLDADADTLDPEEFSAEMQYFATGYRS